MVVVAPALIMPLFNKFTPLPAGGRRDGLFALGDRAGFRARDIQVMDGSKRSRHSNAFFTGLGRFRKIILFDTLVQQLDQPELESVLAHEIGHYKKGHILKRIVLAMGGSLPFFFLVALLAKADWLLRGFGFAPWDIVPALLLFCLLAGMVTFWVAPVFHLLSRRHEYEADAYAASLIKRNEPLIAALRKLNEKNLSNLAPHPLYSGFYYKIWSLLRQPMPRPARTVTFWTSAPVEPCHHHFTSNWSRSPGNRRAAGSDTSENEIHGGPCLDRLQPPINRKGPGGKAVAEASGR